MSFSRPILFFTNALLLFAGAGTALAATKIRLSCASAVDATAFTRHEEIESEHDITDGLARNLKIRDQLQSLVQKQIQAIANPTGFRIPDNLLPEAQAFIKTVYSTLEARKESADLTHYLREDSAEIRKGYRNRKSARKKFEDDPTYENLLDATVAAVKTLCVLERSYLIFSFYIVRYIEQVKAGKELVWFTLEHQTVQSLLESMASRLSLIEFRLTDRPGTFALHDLDHAQLITRYLSPDQLKWLRSVLSQLALEKDPLLKRWVLLLLFAAHESPIGFAYSFGQKDTRPLDFLPTATDAYRLSKEPRVRASEDQYLSRANEWLQNQIKALPVPEYSGFRTHPTF